MTHQLLLHEAAVRELDDIYDYIADRAGADTAWRYIEGLQLFLQRLTDFPERGTIREEAVPGLRVIGYQRRLSVAFLVRAETVVILGLFYAGRQIDVDILRSRAT